MKHCLRQPKSCHQSYLLLIRKACVTCLWLHPQTVMMLMVVGYRQGQPQPLLLWQRRLLPLSGKQVHRQLSHKYRLDQSLLVPPSRSGYICCCMVFKFGLSILRIAHNVSCVV